MFKEIIGGHHGVKSVRMASISEFMELTRPPWIPQSVLAIEYFRPEMDR